MVKRNKKEINKNIIDDFAVKEPATIQKDKKSNLVDYGCNTEDPQANNNNKEEDNKKNEVFSIVKRLYKSRYGNLDALKKYCNFVLLRNNGMKN